MGCACTRVQPVQALNRPAACFKQPALGSAGAELREPRALRGGLRGDPGGRAAAGGGPACADALAAAPEPRHAAVRHTFLTDNPTTYSPCGQSEAPEHHSMHCLNDTGSPAQL